MTNETDQQVLFILGRLEGKVDAVHSDMEDIKKRAASYEERVISLERSKSYMMGFWACVSGIIAFCVSFFVKWS